MPLRGREKEAIISADKLHRKGGWSWKEGGRGVALGIRGEIFHAR